MVQQKNATNSAHMGLMEGFGVSLQNQPRLSRLQGPKKQAAAVQDTVGRFNKSI